MPRARRRGGGNDPAIDSGARDQRITLQQRVKSRATSGLPVEEWVDLAEADASKSDAGGAERFVAGGITAPYETRWGLDYRPDMDPDVLDVPADRRLIHRGRVHDIVDAEHIGREEGIELRTIARQG